MVKCNCGAYFLVAFFDGKCPQCGKEYPVEESDRIMKDVSIEICKRINKKLEKKELKQ